MFDHNAEFFYVIKITVTQTYIKNPLSFLFQYILRTVNGHHQVLYSDQSMQTEYKYILKNLYRKYRHAHI
jgi:hypothetical protein